MHGKITVVEYSELLNRFLPCIQNHQPPLANVFSTIPTPRNEMEMYEALVSDVLLIKGAMLIRYGPSRQ